MVCLLESTYKAHQFFVFTKKRRFLNMEDNVEGVLVTHIKGKAQRKIHLLRKRKKETKNEVEKVSFHLVQALNVRSLINLVMWDKC
ncbi:hypothetical protein CR513_44795, partial [Mucuna pruriens]